jgi:hypothetical protein
MSLILYESLLIDIYSYYICSGLIVDALGSLRENSDDI